MKERKKEQQCIENGGYWTSLDIIAQEIKAKKNPRLTEARQRRCPN